MRTLLAVALTLALGSTTAHAKGLSIEVTDVASDSGNVLVQISGSAQAWDGKAEAAARSRVAASKGSVTIEFPDLAPGEYAVSVLHDENENQRMDSNLLGIPSEGYGFSNNPRVMRKATFEEARIEVGEDGANIVIQMR